ncbi:MAG: phage major capsid protein, partial [Lachnospiraceae bacterium]|nr:phage major capsid protein [Lachnospiraceae bacterium]
MRGEAFLRYIYSELAYRIVKKMADVLVEKINALDATGSATAPKQAVITAAPAMATVATAIGNLTDEAENPVIIMNKLTYAAFKAVQYANGYGVDPFEGLPVKFNNTLPAYSAASTNDIYMIVGDLGYGAMANFPDGDVIDFKLDELTRKKEDMIEVLGKEYVAIEVVACKAFCQVKKPAVI